MSSPDGPAARQRLDAVASSTAEVLQSADQIIEEAAKRELTIKLSGGVGCWLRCPDARSRIPYAARSFSDIDWVALSRERSAINRLFKELGYIEDPRIASIPGLRRSLFRHPQEVRCDVFYDVLEFCHTIDLRKRLNDSVPSIPLADLLLQKLQIVELTTKDAHDICMLLVEHEVSSDIVTIDCDYIAELCRKDWGLYRTVICNIEKITSLSNSDEELPATDRDAICSRCATLRANIEGASKSVGWRLRAILGDRIKWYATVDALGEF